MRPRCGTVITIPVYDMSSAATQYYQVHRPGSIVRAYLTPTTTFIGSTTPEVFLFILRQATDVSVVTVQVTGLNGVAHMTEGTLTVATGTVGHSDFQLYDTNNTVARGDIIAVVPTALTGSATGSGTVANGPDVTVTIIIE